MREIHITKIIYLFAVSVLLFGCQTPNLSKIKEIPATVLNAAKSSNVIQNIAPGDVNVDNTIPLRDILDGSLANKNQGSDFISSLKYALDTDPVIISKRRDVEAKLAAVGSSKAQKEFQVGTTIYGGIEDITDNTKGVALSINASKLIFDGGKLDYRVASVRFAAEAAQLDLIATIDKRAFDLCRIWLELEKYRTLQGHIDRRLSVLDPLIDQLEQVAKAGIGDVSKVTAAQRTVAAIRVEQSNISEGLAQAELEFLNAFGVFSNEISFEYDFISNLVPRNIDNNLIKKSPLLLSQYANYQSSVATLKALRAKDGFDVGFEANALRPFAGSGYDSDESIGLVGRKTLFNGGMLDAEIKEAEALVDAAAARIKATYREGARSVRTALQNIDSMGKAILIARENTKLTADEIAYLRQQLIIGGSTLDSVLSAEARLYDAESKEIKYSTEKNKSELIVLTSLGLLSREIGL